MTKFWLVFTHELKRNATRGGYIFATLGIPILAVLLFFGYPIVQNLISSEDTETRQQETADALTELALERLEVAGYVDNSGLFGEPASRFDDVLILYLDEASAREALQAEEIDAYLVFAQDYLETGDVTLHLPNVSMMMMGDGSTLAEQLAYSTFASGLDELRLRRLSNPASFTSFDLSLQGSEETTEEATGRTDATDGQQFIVVYGFAVVFFVGLILTNNYLMQTVIEERDNRLVEIFIATVRPSQLLGGKIAAMATLGILQIALWGATFVGLFYLAGNVSVYAEILASANIDIRADLLPLMMVYFVLLYLFYAAVFGTLGVVTNSAQEGAQYAGFLVIPVLVPTYLIPLLQNDPHSILGVGLSLFPLTAPTTVIARMVIDSVSLMEIALSIAILAVFAVGSIWMAGRVFRVQTLLSGKKLAIKDIPRLIFAES
ncbi:MAG: ABC transporter permease [Chloroflexota bacterium]